MKEISKYALPREVSEDEIREVLKHIHKGKSEDFYGLSVENICYAGDKFILFLMELINRVFYHNKIPDMLKMGLVSPIYKKKGEKNESRNYRSITVLPVLLKIIDFILRKDLRNAIDPQQSALQRGFTANCSPMNCGFLVEEFYKDSGSPVYEAMLTRNQPLISYARKY